MIRTIIVGVIFFITISLTFAQNERICHKCEGINCYRTTYNQTEKCLDSLDICVTVFDNDGVIQRGCLLGLPEKNRLKCENKKQHAHCHKCNGDLCNNVNREDLLCIQCNSLQDSKCTDITSTSDITPTRCPIGNSENSYCYTEVNGNNVVRGCSNVIRHQKECLNKLNCMLCLPGDVKGCNRIKFLAGSKRSFFIY